MEPPPRAAVEESPAPRRQRRSDAGASTSLGAPALASFAPAPPASSSRLHRHAASHEDAEALLERANRERGERASAILFDLFRVKERLIEDYSCAINDQMILHGRLYTTESGVYFYSNIFGKDLRKTLPFAQMERVIRRNTALVMPVLEFTMASPRIDGTPTTVLFLSFFGLCRDDCYATVLRLHQQHRPELYGLPRSSLAPRAATAVPTSPHGAMASSPEEPGHATTADRSGEHHPRGHSNGNRSLIHTSSSIGSMLHASGSSEASRGRRGTSSASQRRASSVRRRASLAGISLEREGAGDLASGAGLRAAVPAEDELSPRGMSAGGEEHGEESQGAGPSSISCGACLGSGGGRSGRCNACLGTGAVRLGSLSAGDGASEAYGEGASQPSDAKGSSGAPASLSTHRLDDTACNSEREEGGLSDYDELVTQQPRVPSRAEGGGLDPALDAPRGAVASNSGPSQGRPPRYSASGSAGVAQTLPTPPRLSHPAPLSTDDEAPGAAATRHAGALSPLMPSIGLDHWVGLPLPPAALWSRLGGYRMVLDVVLPCSVAAFHDHFMSDAAVLSIPAFHQGRGDFSIVVSPWKETAQSEVAGGGGGGGRSAGALHAVDASGDGRPDNADAVVRTIKLRMPLEKHPLAPKDTRVEKTQRYAQYAGPLLIVDTSARSLDIPFADYFITEDTWVVAPVGFALPCAAAGGSGVTGLPSTASKESVQNARRLLRSWKVQELPENDGSAQFSTEGAPAASARLCRLVVLMTVTFSKTTILRGTIRSKAESNILQFQVGVGKGRCRCRWDGMRHHRWGGMPPQGRCLPACLCPCPS